MAPTVWIAVMIVIAGLCADAIDVIETRTLDDETLDDQATTCNFDHVYEYRLEAYELTQQCPKTQEIRKIQENNHIKNVTMPDMNLTITQSEKEAVYLTNEHYVEELYGKEAAVLNLDEEDVVILMDEGSRKRDQSAERPWRKKEIVQCDQGDHCPGAFQEHGAASVPFSGILLPHFARHSPELAPISASSSSMARLLFPKLLLLLVRLNFFFGLPGKSSPRGRLSSLPPPPSPARVNVHHHNVPHPPTIQKSPD